MLKGLTPLAAAGLLCSACGPSPEQLERRQSLDAQIATVVLCETAVEQRLRSPGSADFPFGHVVTVTHLSGNRHELVSYVDSQNLFGAVLRTHFRCVTEGTGEDPSGYRIVTLETG